MSLIFPWIKITKIKIWTCTWLTRSVSNALVWPVCALLLVSVLCCLQVPFNNMTFPVHKTLEDQLLRCFMLRVPYPGPPRHKTFTHLSFSIWHYTGNNLTQVLQICEDLDIDFVWQTWVVSASDGLQLICLVYLSRAEELKNIFLPFYAYLLTKQVPLAVNELWIRLYGTAPYFNKYS